MIDIWNFMVQVSDSPSKSEKAPVSGADSSQRSTAGRRLIDQVREAIRSRHYSRRTEKTYWYWIKYFIVFSGKRHPRMLNISQRLTGMGVRFWHAKLSILVKLLLNIHCLAGA